MPKEIIIRKAELSDYAGLRMMEEKAWEGTGVEVISEDIFKSWLKVFPEGVLIALVDDVVCGHIFCQICDFFPDDLSDNRNWKEITDNGTAARTNNPNGNCLYVVSISATYSGAGVKLINESVKLALLLKKSFFAGGCRMPGLSRYIKRKLIEIPSYQDVIEYALLVSDTIKRKRKEKIKYFDPVLSTFLSTRKNSRVCRVVEDYFSDQQSLNWACIISFKLND